MTAALLTITVLLSILTALMFGALVEMYRQLAQLRADSGLLDVPIAIDARPAAALPAEQLGFRVPSEPTNETDRHAILFLSDSCSTCASVARGVPFKFTHRLTILVEARDETSAAEWMATNGLTELPQAHYDRDRVIADGLGVDVIPSVVLFENGESVGAHTVPSPRHIKPIQNWLSGTNGYPFEQLIADKGRHIGTLPEN